MARVTTRPDTGNTMSVATSASTGRHRCRYSSSRHRADRSASCSRCITTTIAPVFGVSSRVDSVSRKNRKAASRCASLSAWWGLCRSSTMIRSPPLPVAEPPTEVAHMTPWRVFRNSPLTF